MDSIIIIIIITGQLNQTLSVSKYTIKQIALTNPSSKFHMFLKTFEWTVSYCNEKSLWLDGSM
jgi:hypothetical protein